MLQERVLETLKTDKDKLDFDRPNKRLGQELREAERFVSISRGTLTGPFKTLYLGLISEPPSLKQIVTYGFGREC